MLICAWIKPKLQRDKIDPSGTDTCSIKLPQLLLLLKGEGLPLVIAFRFVGIALKKHTHTHTSDITTTFTTILVLNAAR